MRQTLATDYPPPPARATHLTSAFVVVQPLSNGESADAAENLTITWIPPTPFLPPIPSLSFSAGVDQDQYEQKGNAWIKQTYPGINFCTDTSVTPSVTSTSGGVATEQ